MAVTMAFDRRPPLRFMARVLLSGCLACQVIAFVAEPAAAQVRPATMQDRLAVANDLNTGVGLAQQVMRVLQSGPGTEALKQADATVVRAYLQWNKAAAGVHSIELRSKFPDPMLGHVTKIINDARMTISAAHTQIGGAAAYEAQRQEQIARALQLLTEAITLAQRAAELISV
jgi:hypothetical protein